MPKRVTLRSLTDEEREVLEQLRRSRKAEQRQVERARIILGLAEGRRPSEIAGEVGRSEPTVYERLHRFNEQGLKSLKDGPRSGRPMTYSEEERGRMVVTAKTRPSLLGLEYSHWTLDRLVEYVNQGLNIPISRSQLGEILHLEGLKWYQEQTYFTESPDPQFAEKRGR
jgi:transposase